MGLTTIITWQSRFFKLEDHSGFVSGRLCALEYISYHLFGTVPICQMSGGSYPTFLTVCSRLLGDGPKATPCPLRAKAAQSAPPEELNSL